MINMKETIDMRKNFGPQTTIYPMPVFIIGTYDENMVPDAMNAAWGMQSDMGEITLICFCNVDFKNLSLPPGRNNSGSLPKK